MSPARLLPRALRRLLGREDGAATVEFVLLFTPMVMIMTMGAEAGLLNLRHVMLERGLDIAVRTVRLGPATPPDHDEFKQMICENALLLPDCENALKVEMRRVSKEHWNVLDGPAECRDRSEEVKPPKQYKPGAPSDLMLVRACIKMRPLFPTAGLGAQLHKDANGDYAAIATGVFVNEPL